MSVWANRRAGRRIAAALLAGSALAACPAMAQDAPTAIVADMSNATSLGTRVAADGSVVLIGGGTVAGENLFHSFAQFDLARGDSAVWQAPGEGAIANIVNRVTGDLPSRISGTIDTTAMPGADFWFINPNGVLLGEGLRLDVPGASHFTTASQLQFTDGAMFSTRAADGSTLSMASPAAFGFLGGEGDAALVGAGEGLAGQSGLPRLQIVAPNVAVSGAQAALGRLDLVASGDAAAVSLDAPLVSGANGELAMDLNHIRVFAGDSGDGGVTLAAGNVALTQTWIETFTDTARDAAPIAVQAAGAITLDRQSSLRSHAQGLGAASDIALHAGDFISLSESQIVSTTTGPGNGGNIALATPGTLFVSQATIEADTLDGDPGSSLPAIGGNGGSVVIAADAGMLLDRPDIFTSTFTTGSGGNIVLRSAGPIAISGGRIVAESAAFPHRLQGLAGGQGGSILVSSLDTLSLDGVLVTSSAFNTARGGDITLLAEGGIETSDGEIRALTTGSGQGGAVLLFTPGDIAISGTRFETSTFGDGDAGTVTVSAGGELAIAGAEFVTNAENADSLGNAGGILTLSEGATSISGSSFSALARGLGNGGYIDITATGSLSVSEGSELRAAVVNSANAGQAGYVSLSSEGGLVVTDSVASVDTSGSGGAGFLLLQSGGDARIARSRITADTRGEGTGTGGYIGLSATGDLVIDASQIFADTYGSGDGGYIGLEVGGNATLRNGSFVTTESLGRGDDAGDGGALLLDVGGTFAMDDSTLSATTFGGGDGGFIDIASGAIALANGSAISASTRAQGLSGYIAIDTGAMTLADATVATSSAGTGDALGVTIIAASLAIGRGGSIEAVGSGAGAAGFVDVTADAIRIVEDGSISTSAQGSGRAGAISITGDTVLVDGRAPDGAASRIVSENTYQGLSPGSANAAGDIFVTARTLTVSNGGQINTNSLRGNAGIIAIDLAGTDRPDAILRLSGSTAPGTITTSSFGGRGGSGDAGAIFVTGAYAVIAQGSVISASGRTDSAFVRIDAPVRINSSDRANVVDIDGYSAVSPE